MSLMYLEQNTVRITTFLLVSNMSLLILLLSNLKSNLIRVQNLTLFLNCLKYIYNYLNLSRSCLDFTKERLLTVDTIIVSSFFTDIFDDVSDFLRIQGLSRSARTSRQYSFRYIILKDLSNYAVF